LKTLDLAYASAILGMNENSSSNEASPDLDGVFPCVLVEIRLFPEE
jgi:hypothetical protein